MRKRFFSLFLALIMLFALLPALAGSAKADAASITMFRLAYDGTLQLPQNGDPIQDISNKFYIAGTEPEGLASQLEIWSYWVNWDTSVQYSSGTFTPGTWKLFVHVSIKDSSKYVYDHDSFTAYDSLFFNAGGKEFSLSGLSTIGAYQDINYSWEFVIGASESYSPIRDVPIFIRKPVVGEYPDYEPTVASRAHCYSADYTGGIFKNDVVWKDTTTNHNLDPDAEQFVAGHSYEVLIYLTPEEGYRFVDDVEGSLYNKMPMESTNRDDLGQASFVYEFPVTAKPVASVGVSLTEPKVGAKPDYNAVPAAPMYDLRNYNNRYFQSGVGWFDETDNKYLTPNDTFKAGHAYGVQIYLEPELYQYAFNDETAGVLNGKYTMSKLGDLSKKDQICFFYTFQKLQDPKYNGTVELNPDDVQLNGKTPYRVYDGKAQKPGVIVKDKSGKVVAASKYTVSYRDNVNPGTAYAEIKMKDTGATASVWFKIYLPPTKTTTVQNVQNGIQISWKKVDGAKGYVIYRRAWNLVDKGWTKFERWNNTTKTTWTDTKVYAGTRYQYGVKAYFSDAMDNYNLGIVGPLKTTVRITTRTLNSVTPGSKKLTVKWSGSKLFTGYEVQVATDKNFTKDVKTVTVKKAKTYQTAVSGLKAKTTYYVRVRSYHVFEGMTYYGGWSNVLSGKTK